MAKITKIAIGLFVLFLAWTLVVVSSGLGWNPTGLDWNFSNTGTLGDSFGPISAMMASAAALAAFAAFQSQSEELSRLKSREADEDVRAQKFAFEQTFFQLLDHHRKIVESIDIDGSGAQKTGQDAFKSIEHFFRNHRAAGLKIAWDRTYERYQNDLGHYFRFLYHIVSFVAKSPVHEKYFYIQILRATLSESELVLLALNCKFGHGRDRFRTLIEEFALLHNISAQARERWELDESFAPGAFDLLERAEH